MPFRLMRDARDASVRMARARGHGISIGERDYVVMRNFNPHWIDQNIWQVLCNEWDTESFHDRSTIARSYRSSEGSSDPISKHSGGSITMDEVHKKLTKDLGRVVTFPEVFKETHLKKSSEHF